MSFIDKINRFATNPVNMNMKRSKFNLSHGYKTTLVAGKLVPIFCEEVLPDDTFKINVSSVIRSITPAVPVMDNAFLDVFAFWVPARLCTVHEKDWQKIHGENTAGYWAPATESTLSNTGNTFIIGSSSDAVQVQSLANYFGLPIGFYHSTMELSRLPFNAYWLIYNEWFRNENLIAPIDWKSFNNATFLQNACQNVSLRGAGKYHDYFTSSLPSPQKSNPVLLPMAGTAPVKTGSTSQNTNGWASLSFKTTSNATTAGVLSVDPNGHTYATGSSSTGTDVVPANLYADLSAATAVSVNQMREAFAIQRLFEKDSRGGTRYRECLMTHFGISIPDNTVQVPEYLGGKRIPLNQLQVIQSVADSSTPLGNTGAFSNTADSSDICVKSFPEFGYVILIATIRNNQSYSQGIDKLFTRNRRFDFYYPVFANLGEMAVKTTEIYATNASDLTEVFGYQECWAEYRNRRNLITGYLAAGSGDSVAQQWTYGNQFSAKPVLNQAFNAQPRDQIDNTLVVKNANYQFICDFWFNFTAWRAMPYYSIPGLIDHH